MVNVGLPSPPNPEKNSGTPTYVWVIGLIFIVIVTSVGAIKAYLNDKRLHNSIAILSAMVLTERQKLDQFEAEVQRRLKKSEKQRHIEKAKRQKKSKFKKRKK